ncbi:MAG: hypothetical protein PVG39_18055 [Desulfobacteraceae bacterium]
MTKGKAAALKIFLSSILRNYIPGYDPNKGHEAEIKQVTTVTELCRQINVPAELVTIVMVDGRMQGHDYVLNGTERIYLFPSIGGG